MPNALFEPLGGDRYLPGPATRGPWSRDALHGGPVAALVAGAAEVVLEEMFPARVTVELLRPVPVAPLTVTAREIRPGRKVRLVGVEVATEDGTVVTSATVLGIRRADVDAPDTFTAAEPPPPAESGQPAERSAVSTSDDYDAFHNKGVEHRFVRGTFHQPGPATDWIRLQMPVVPDVAPTPLQRVMAAADFGNGVSHVVPFDKLLFINPDLTVHLHRLPEGEWVCLDAASSYEPHGVGLAQSELWDEHGPIGRALQSLLLDSR